MLGQRLRRWANIEQTWGERLVFAVIMRIQDLNQCQTTTRRNGSASTQPHVALG